MWQQQVSSKEICYNDHMLDVQLPMIWKSMCSGGGVKQNKLSFLHSVTPFPIIVTQSCRLCCTTSIIGLLSQGSNPGFESHDLPKREAGAELIRPSQFSPLLSDFVFIWFSLFFWVFFFSLFLSPFGCVCVGGSFPTFSPPFLLLLQLDIFSLGSVYVFVMREMRITSNYPPITHTGTHRQTQILTDLTQTLTHVHTDSHRQTH